MITVLEMYDVMLGACVTSGYDKEADVPFDTLDEEDKNFLRALTEGVNALIEKGLP